ncbi:unnamed protein product [Cylicocyclus nassatus]|uniref:Uncharacterized protein n=1 Tax=Cylicocyclus nassatus TaxID=53992 RepID=A0AA36GUA2_CYLNA|nr:unnamed protein product [Cylicocyclus nassatus]
MQDSCNHYYRGWYQINQNLRYSPLLECLLKTEYANRKYDHIKIWDVFEVRVMDIREKNRVDRGFIDRAVWERYRLCYSASMKKLNRVFACTTYKRKGTGLYHEHYTPMYGCAFDSSEELRKLFRAGKSLK